MAAITGDRMSATVSKSVYFFQIGKQIKNFDPSQYWKRMFPCHSVDGNIALLTDPRLLLPAQPSLSGRPESWHYCFDQYRNISHPPVCQRPYVSASASRANKKAGILLQTARKPAFLYSISLFYLFRFISSCSISSDVVITLEFAWNPLCATIIFTNSVARSTFDCSRELGFIFPVPDTPGALV